MHLVQAAVGVDAASSSSEDAFFETVELRREADQPCIEPQLVRAVVLRHDLHCAAAVVGEA